MHTRLDFMCFRVLILLTAIALAAGSVCVASNHSPKGSWTGKSSQSDSKSNSSPQDCLTIAEAQKHVGRTHCVTGTVIRVEEGNSGVTFLDFCTDYQSCPFTVIVFPGDLSNVGDVRQLQGHTVNIKGTIEEYDDRAEIILRHPQQLGDGAAMLPAIPKDYDVERQGHYSAGTFRAKKAKKPKHTRQGPPISITDAEEP